MLFLLESFRMQIIKKIIPVLINRYFLAAVGFIVWMLFFDQRDYFQQRERASELKKVEAAKKYYNEEIDQTKKQLNNLQNNPAAIEKYARERYLLKRDGEEVYLFEDTVRTPATPADKK
jgi:cell division protein FtsB